MFAYFDTLIFETIYLLKKIFNITRRFSFYASAKTDNNFFYQSQKGVKIVLNSGVMVFYFSKHSNNLKAELLSDLSQIDIFDQTMVVVPNDEDRRRLQLLIAQEHGVYMNIPIYTRYQWLQKMSRKVFGCDLLTRAEYVFRVYDWLGQSVHLLHDVDLINRLGENINNGQRRYQFAQSLVRQWLEREDSYVNETDDDVTTLQHRFESTHGDALFVSRMDSRPLIVEKTDWSILLYGFDVLPKSILRLVAHTHTIVDYRIFMLYPSSEFIEYVDHRSKTLQKTLQISQGMFKSIYEMTDAIREDMDKPADCFKSLLPCVQHMLSGDCEADIQRLSNDVDWTPGTFGIVSFDNVHQEVSAVLANIQQQENKSYRWEDIVIILPHDNQYLSTLQMEADLRDIPIRVFPRDHTGIAAQIMRAILHFLHSPWTGESLKWFLTSSYCDYQYDAFWQWFDSKYTVVYNDIHRAYLSKQNELKGACIVDRILDTLNDEAMGFDYEMDGSDAERNRGIATIETLKKAFEMLWTDQMLTMYQWFERFELCVTSLKEIASPIGEPAYDDVMHQMMMTKRQLSSESLMVSVSQDVFIKHVETFIRLEDGLNTMDSALSVYTRQEMFNGHAKALYVLGQDSDGNNDDQSQHDQYKEETHARSKYHYLLLFFSASERFYITYTTNGSDDTVLHPWCRLFLEELNTLDGIEPFVFDSHAEYHPLVYKTQKPALDRQFQRDHKISNISLSVVDISRFFNDGYRFYLNVHSDASSQRIRAFNPISHSISDQLKCSRPRSTQSVPIRDLGPYISLMPQNQSGNRLYQIMTHYYGKQSRNIYFMSQTQQQLVDHKWCCSNDPIQIGDILFAMHGQLATVNNKQRCCIVAYSTEQAFLDMLIVDIFLRDDIPNITYDWFILSEKHNAKYLELKPSRPVFDRKKLFEALSLGVSYPNPFDIYAMIRYPNKPEKWWEIDTKRRDENEWIYPSLTDDQVASMKQVLEPIYEYMSLSIKGFMTRSFNVLDPHLDTTGSLFIEASAGTGKTFAIEHLVIRSLFETAGLRLSDLLLVTFTKKSQRDMKQRVLMQLMNIHQSLRRGDRNKLPDYLTPLLEQDESLVQVVVESALTAIDQLNVFTIHGYCHRLLQRYYQHIDPESDPLELCSVSAKESCIVRFLNDTQHQHPVIDYAIESIYQNKLDVLFDDVLSVDAQSTHSLNDDINTLNSLFDAYQRNDHWQRCIMSDHSWFASFLGCKNRAGQVKGLQHRRIMEFHDILLSRHVRLSRFRWFWINCY